MMLTYIMIIILKHGSVVVRPQEIIFRFGIRHTKNARKDILTSTFYRRYPSIHRNRDKSSTSGRKGYFENLVQYVALGFEFSNCEVEKNLTSIKEDECMFLFSKEDVEHITKMKKRGSNTWECKCIDMISYRIELFFDLSISPLDNVSDNPGF